MASKERRKRGKRRLDENKSAEAGASGRMQEPAECWVSGGVWAEQIPVFIALQLQVGLEGNAWESSCCFGIFLVILGVGKVT